MPEDIQDCRRCDLWQRATQAVGGEGPAHARIMLVGEQPGNDEDLEGRPFVGPAGRTLEQCLAAAGLKRESIFLTNAVKHFKWEPRGKRRLHSRPSPVQISACNRWLQLEIGRVKPAVIVALGATALRALVGRLMTVESARGATLQHDSGAHLVATYHPSAILRVQGGGGARMQTMLVEDLQKAQRLGGRT